MNLVNDQLQETESNTCGLFQFCFYENLFLPLPNSKIIKEKQLNKKTIATLLNGIFVLDEKENERRIKKYNNKPRSTNLFNRKKRLQYRCFLVAKFSRTPILKKICAQLLMNWFYEMIVWSFVSGPSLLTPF